MKIKINNISYDIPASLSAVTLQQRIDFENRYGKDLRKQLEDIGKLKDETEKEVKFTYYHCTLAAYTISFFGNVPMDVIGNTHTDDLLAIYHGIMHSYADDIDFTSKEVNLLQSFSWKEELWEIAPPVLHAHSKMTFGELIVSKQVTQNMLDFGGGKWEALLPLCCVYFRKKDEPFNQEMMDESGERYSLMKSLPLDYALQVGFFLSSSMNSWKTTFLSSVNLGGSLPADLPSNT